jgi:hypothetical protein
MWLEARSEEFAAAKYGLIVVAQQIITLRQFHFWQSLQGPRQLVLSLPDRALIETLECLNGESPNMTDLVAAMETIGDAVQSMNDRFSGAKFHPDEDWNVYEIVEREEEEDEEEQEYDEEEERKREKDREYARYKCAAMLSIFIELVEDVLSPLSKEIAAAPARTPARKHAPPKGDGE